METSNSGFQVGDALARYRARHPNQQFVVDPDHELATSTWAIARIWTLDGVGSCCCTNRIGLGHHHF